MDEFANHATGLTTPATRHFPIIPDDDSDLAIIPRVIYCQAAGDIVIRDEHGSDIVYNLTAGDLLSFRAVRVLSSGTNGTFYGWS